MRYLLLVLCHHEQFASFVPCTLLSYVVCEACDFSAGFVLGLDVETCVFQSWPGVFRVRHIAETVWVVRKAIRHQCPRHMPRVLSMLITLQDCRRLLKVTIAPSSRVHNSFLILRIISIRYFSCLCLLPQLNFDALLVCGEVFVDHAHDRIFIIVKLLILHVDLVVLALEFV